MEKRRDGCVNQRAPVDPRIDSDLELLFFSYHDPPELEVTGDVAVGEGSAEPPMIMVEYQDKALDDSIVREPPRSAVPSSTEVGGDGVKAKESGKVVLHEVGSQSAKRRSVVPR